MYRIFIVSLQTNIIYNIVSQLSKWRSMKKWLVFGGGFLSGVVLTFLVLLIIGLANSNNGGLIGATYFDEPVEEIDVNSFEVMQVIQDNAALVRSKDTQTYGTIYLLVITMMMK